MRQLRFQATSDGGADGGSALMWALCRRSADWKSPPHCSSTPQLWHSEKKIFFQSEMDFRANFQCEGRNRHNCELYNETFIPRTLNVSTACSSSSWYSVGSIQSFSLLRGVYPVGSNPIKAT